MPVPWHDADFIDRLWDYVLHNFPQIPPDDAARVKREMRQELGGERRYVRSRDSGNVLAQEVLRLFNGRNATEVARRLDISRASVYRYIKQAGRQGPAA